MRFGNAVTASSLAVGSQLPRVEAVAAGSSHPDAVAALELVEAAGLILDPWQKHVLERSLMQRDRRWAAFEIALVCPRQNGKNGILEARELAGLFVLGERLIIHSAHLADTSREAFRRLDELIDANEWLSREVKHVWRTNGHEAIELKNGQRVRFRTRTKGGGRGFSGDCVIFDEAMVLTEASHGAILPVLSARPNPQVWYTGSAVDQMIHTDGLVLARVRDRGLSGGDDSLAYFEWSADAVDPSGIPDETLADPETWAQANPALGIRITADYIEKERRAMDPRTFAVERLCVGDWPDPDGDRSVIDLDLWRSLEDVKSQLVGRPCLAFDVTPDRSASAIGVCGARDDENLHLEVIEDRRGTGWLVDRLVELAQSLCCSVVCDGAGPAGSLIGELERRGVTVVAVTAREYGQACGMFFDAVEQHLLRHIGQQELTGAIRGAAMRPLGEAWAWSRKNSLLNISPLITVTLALWGFQSAIGVPKVPRVVNLNDIPDD